MTKQIRISDGSFVTVDAEDFELLTKRKWHQNGNGYASRRDRKNGRYVKVYMHRLLMGNPIGLQVDHINGDKTDNRKANLRIATSQQNSMNIGLRANNTSGYKGVRYDSRRDKWQAEIKKNYQNRFLGYFDCKHEAAKAYNKAAIEMHGDFANINEITEVF